MASIQELIQANEPRLHQRDFAEAQDECDELRHFRDEFIFPTKADLKRKTLKADETQLPSDSSIYLCGNSLGLQPRRTRERINTFLTQWAIKGVHGHFTEHTDSPLAPWLHVDDAAAKLAAPIVGAQTEEVAVMGTLTANLHMLMASFYTPTKERYKIIIEGKAFPSDHYAVESQITLHGFDPSTAMVQIEPRDTENRILTTAEILSIIDTHASTTALILLPAVQYYTGQYFDIAAITAHAHSHGILIGWDCAHGAGNVDLKLHAWDVDFAAWCHYKYCNSGPGGMAGMFVHERHGQVKKGEDGSMQFRPRLTGWWGDDKSTRFRMENKFIPRPGAAGFQVSNPSALDLAAVTASLELFNSTSMTALRSKSLSLTAYLEHLLLTAPFAGERPFSIITPSDPKQRGAQLSVRLHSGGDVGFLEKVLARLEDEGVVIDERKPDVIRVAPAPMYNNYSDVWKFVQIFIGACREVVGDSK